MYGLKKDIDLSFLNGRERIQIAIGLFHVSFRFDEEVAISVEGEFLYFDGNAEWISKHERNSSVVAARTVALLGTTIQAFQSSTDEL